MAQPDKIDLCIIGAGPAGLAAAEKAVALGAGVTLIDAGAPGGVSHHWGTLPAQALAAIAERAHAIRTARDMGLGAGEPRVNFARVNARIREVIGAAAPDVSVERLTASGIEFIRGMARLTGPGTVAVGERVLRARRILVATGSRPLVPDLPGLDAVPFHTPETIFELTRRPTHLVVVGGGATGLALAQSHARLGAAVTVVDMLNPLGDLDPELAEAVLRRLRENGVVIRPRTGVVAVSGSGEELGIDLKSGPDEERIAASHLLFATGRRPVFDGLNLEAAKLRMDGGRPVLRADGRTSNRRLAVAGDAAGTSGAHAARAGAERAVAALLGRRMAQAAIPTMVHTRPAIAQTGMSEGDAAAAFGERFAITRAGLAATDAARAAGETGGHIKMITGPDGTIAGVGIVGPAAGEQIGLFSLAIGLRLTPERLGELVFPHPSFAEAVSVLARAHARQHGAARPPLWRALPAWGRRGRRG